MTRPLACTTKRPRAQPAVAFVAPLPFSSSSFISWALRSPMPLRRPCCAISSDASPPPSSPPPSAPSSSSVPSKSTSAPSSPSVSRGRPGNHKGFQHSSETKRKISYTMLGQRKSESMKAKVSASLKGRVPWNKGKKLSDETRRRMREAAHGRTAWNKGIPLSDEHRTNISLGAQRRQLSDETIHRMKLARRRPGDAILKGNPDHASRTAIGSYNLIDTKDIHTFIRLRRELASWVDGYFKKQQENGHVPGTKARKRLTLQDVRRVATVTIIRKFEKYSQLRQALRGLAADVYGHIDPSLMPTVDTNDVTSTAVNNNARTQIVVTKYGNNRFDNPKPASSSSLSSSSSSSSLSSSTAAFSTTLFSPSVSFSASASSSQRLNEMYDDYDKPFQSPYNTTSTNDLEINNSLVSVHSLRLQPPPGRRSDHLSFNDFRKIGRHRLMETMEINRYIDLRHDLQKWSAKFQADHGKVPSLSDVREHGSSAHYNKFCEYLDMRSRMEGLVKEVCGTEVDDLETLSKINDEGKQVLKTLTSLSSTKSSSKSSQQPVKRKSQNEDSQLKHDHVTGKEDIVEIDITGN